MCWCRLAHQWSQQGEPILSKNTEERQTERKMGKGEKGKGAGERKGKEREEEDTGEKSGEERERVGEDKRHKFKTQQAPSWFKISCGARGGEIGSS